MISPEPVFDLGRPPQPIMKEHLPNSLLFKEPGLQVLRLHGSPAALGQAHGRMLAEEIRSLRREFLRYLARLTLGVGALPLYLTACAFAWRFKPYIPQPLWEEIQGLAEGAGVHTGLILFINVMDDLLNNVPRCSTFAAPLRNSQPTTFLLGRNLDYPIFAQAMCRFNTVFILQPDTGQPLVSVAWPGYVGTCTGMNFSRVALGQLTASTSDVSLAGMPSGLRNRLALQQQASPLEVAAGITSRPGTMGANLILASPYEALLLEVSARHRAVRLPVEGILTATNHYQSPAMQSRKGTAFRRPPLSPLEDYCFSDDYSRRRNQRLQELLRGQNLNIERAQQILGDPDIANPCDVNSVVFHPEAGELSIAQGLELPISQRGRFRRLVGIFGPQPTVV
jgi:hypothetical protein